MAQNNITYRAAIGGERYGYVGFIYKHICLRKTNSRQVKCIRCPERIGTGQGVWFGGGYGGERGYLHLDCAKQTIIDEGKMGYSKSLLLNVQANHEGKGTWSANEVCDAITRYTFETNAESIDILTTT